jgi:hypothetical protein
VTRAALLAAVTLFLACSKPQPPITDCAPSSDARPICGFHNPEDLALLPSGDRVVVSQMGKMDGSTSGSLVFFDLASEKVQLAYPTPAQDSAPRSDGWGDAACPGAPGTALSPHGLDLAKRPDGAMELLVVNHGGRESVEFFELTSRGGTPGLVWRGCALAPDDSLFNDVSALPDGGFVVTRMLAKGHETRDSLIALLRISTGFVYEWQPGQGFEKLAGTGGPMPNGITVSRDGATLFVNEYLGDEVRKIARPSGKLLGTARISSPDNLNWAPNGRLLVASHNAPLNEITACAQLERGACPFHFGIVELDPERMETVTIYQNSGPPMGAGTSALWIGNELLIGSFAGDRLLRVTLPDWVTKSSGS